MPRMNFDEIAGLARADTAATQRLLRAARVAAGKLVEALGPSDIDLCGYICQHGLLIEVSTGEVVGNTRESALRFSAAIAAGLGARITRQLSDRINEADCATATLEAVRTGSACAKRTSRCE